MLYIIQYPLADLRSFIGEHSYKLDIPTWPLPIPVDEFVRGFGCVHKRKKGGVPAWGAENIYCNAKRSVRLIDLSSVRLGNTKRGLGIAPSCAFRRFFSDGELMCKLEMGFADSKFIYDNKPLLSILRDFLYIKAIIPIKKPDTIVYPLIDLGKPLANFYLQSSTKSPQKHKNQLENWWVNAGEPIFLIESIHQEAIDFPNNAKIVDIKQHKIKIAHLWIEKDGKLIKGWAVYSYDNSYNNRESVRNLRINLLRLHAEKECLKQTLRAIIKGHIKINIGEQTSEKVQAYLNRITRSILQPNRYNLPHNKILEMALNCDNLINQGEKRTIMRAISQIRPEIIKKCDKLIDQNENNNQPITFIYGDTVTVGKIETIKGETVKNVKVNIGDGNTFEGDFTVAENIKHSFTIASKSEVDNDLKKNLKKLTFLVSKLSKKLPVNEARNLTNDLKEFSSETTNPKPPQNLYMKCANRIKTFAKKSVEFGPAITAVITEIIDLIGHN
jgi:hypothetical protein